MNQTGSNLLDTVRIASPCTADWARMTGDAKTRFCGECKLHVHDLSAMTTEEAMAVLRAAGQGRLCVRFLRRTDGRVLTQDCPVGLRRRLRRMWMRAAALLAALWTGGGCTRPGASGGDGGAGGTAGATVPTIGAPRMGEVEMGDVAAPRVPAATPTMGRMIAPTATESPLPTDPPKK